MESMQGMQCLPRDFSGLAIELIASAQYERAQSRDDRISLGSLINRLDELLNQSNQHRVGNDTKEIRDTHSSPRPLHLSMSHP